MDARFAVVISLDAGKNEPRACTLNPDGNKLCDTPLTQDETQLRELCTSPQDHSEVPMIVDQPNTIGARPIRVARDGDCPTYPPGVAMRKAADPCPGNSRPMPGTHASSLIPPAPRPIRCGKLTVKAKSSPHGRSSRAFAEDLAHKTIRALNRIRSLLAQSHPTLERVFVGGSLSTGVLLDLPEKFGTPTGLKHADRARALRLPVPTRAGTRRR